MLTQNVLKRRFWIKWSCFGIGISVYHFILFSLVNNFVKKDFINANFVLFFGICISVLAPLLITFFTPPNKKKNKEYGDLELSFEKSGAELFATAFGSKVFEKFYVEDMKWLQENGIEICQELLRRNESKKSDNLRFHLFYKLAQYYFKDGQYQKAINSLREALSIKPNDFIANLKIADLYEMIGSGDNAITHYELALTDTNITSMGLKNFITEQIKRVRSEGPKVRKPPSGIKWMAG